MSLSFRNRSFKYGDGLFETLRLHYGKIAFLQAHYERLKHGLLTLGMELPKDFSADWLLEEILKSIYAREENADASCWRVRISFWRADGGLYTPTDNKAQWFVEYLPLSNDRYELNSTGYLVGKYEQVRLSADILSPLKTTSALPYVMAGIHCKQQERWNDCLLLNSHGRVAEGVAANIFLWMGEALYTPALSEGPVSGVLRRTLIDIAQKHDIQVHETALTATHFHEAEEIWLSNVMQGIRWVEHLTFLPQRSYCADQAETFVRYLNERLLY